MSYCLALDVSPHMARLDEVLEAPLGPDRETWGTTPREVEAAQAMEALAGGPARPK